MHKHFHTKVNQAQEQWAHGVCKVSVLQDFWDVTGQNFEKASLYSLVNLLWVEGCAADIFKVPSNLNVKKWLYSILFVMKIDCFSGKSHSLLRDTL